MFEITVRTSFEASHALRGYRGGDEAPHSHRWRCEVTIVSGELDAAGCAVDFALVDAALARAIAPLSGHSLNECAAFARENPSTENVARFLSRALAGQLNTPSRRVARVTVWEDEDHSATYYE